MPRINRARNVALQAPRRRHSPRPFDPPAMDIEVVAEDHEGFNLASRQPDVNAWIASNMPASAVPQIVVPEMSSGNANQPSTEILAYTLGNPANPSVFMQAGIHGSEFLATHYLMEFVRRVADPAGLANEAMYTAIANQLHLVIIPCLSPAAYQPALASFPDGTYKAPGHHQAEPWYPHLGTNPNRNYPWRWDEYSVIDPSNPSYKGLAALDLPEAEASVELFQRFTPIAGVDMHTYSADEAPEWGIDRQGTSFAAHYESWSADRQAEISDLLPGSLPSQMNITGAPTATGWWSQQLAPDGHPVFGQIIEVGAVAGPDQLRSMGSMALTVNLVLCRAFIASAEARRLYAT